MRARASAPCWDAVSSAALGAFIHCSKMASRPVMNSGGAGGVPPGRSAARERNPRAPVASRCQTRRASTVKGAAGSTADAARRRASTPPSGRPESAWLPAACSRRTAWARSAPGARAPSAAASRRSFDAADAASRKRTSFMSNGRSRP